NNAVSITTPVRAFVGAVAVVASERDKNWQEEVRAKIESSGFFTAVDYRLVSSGTTVPTLSELQAYGAVLVYVSSSLNDEVAMGDVLADYVDAGFGVVVASDAFVF